MNENETNTSITIKKSTHDFLKECGKKADTWDTLLVSLANFYLKYKPIIDAQRELNI